MVDYDELDAMLLQEEEKQTEEELKKQGERLEAEKIRMEALSEEEHDIESASKRKETKRLIQQLKKTNPAVEANIFNSMHNVALDAVLAYKTKGEKHHFLDTY